MRESGSIIAHNDGDKTAQPRAPRTIRHGAQQDANRKSQIARANGESRSESNRIKNQNSGWKGWKQNTNKKGGGGKQKKGGGVGGGRSAGDRASEWRRVYEL